MLKKSKMESSSRKETASESLNNNTFFDPIIKFLKNGQGNVLSIHPKNVYTKSHSSMAGNGCGYVNGRKLSQPILKAIGKNTIERIYNISVQLNHQSHSKKYESCFLKNCVDQWIAKDRSVHIIFQNGLFIAFFHMDGLLFFQTSNIQFIDLFTYFNITEHMINLITRERTVRRIYRR